MKTRLPICLQAECSFKPTRSFRQHRTQGFIFHRFTIYGVLEKLLQGKCAITPIGGLGEETGGYKGYGFTTVVEILSSALQQGAFLRRLNGRDEQGNPIPYALGHFFMAIDIECFTDLASFKKTTGDILRGLRGSAKVPGQERIYTCGEKEYLASEENRRKGVPLLDKIVEELKVNGAAIGTPFEAEAIC